MRFVTIVGARPQFVKAAPLSLELRKRHEEFLVHTGQHYDDNMSDVFFRELDIPEPDRHLGVGSGSHGWQTGAMLERIEGVLQEIRPHAVIVLGDTNSTLAGALAAAKLRIPVAHVEAGLRSFNRSMPEEINRVVADHVATWLFAPSETAVKNLAAEGISGGWGGTGCWVAPASRQCWPVLEPGAGKMPVAPAVTGGVYEVGDIMADSVRLFRRRARERSDILQRLALRPGEYCVATVHRAGNTDSKENLQSILEGLGRIPWPVVFPCHPRTKAAIHRHGLAGLAGWPSTPTDAAPRNGRLQIIDPLGYLDMLQLEQHARVIFTDSGGMQKEAYYLGVPCVTLREETEWPETVQTGWNGLAGANPTQIEGAVARLNLPRTPGHPALYGDGDTASRIAQILGDSSPTPPVRHSGFRLS